MPKLNELQLEACACAAYEALITVNCKSPGGGKLPHWSSLSSKARQDYIEDAADYIDGMTLGQLHEKQLDHYKSEGWSHGPVRDEKKKQDPAIVPWSQLEFKHRANDYIVSEIAKTLARLFEEFNSEAWGAQVPDGKGGD